MTKMNNLGEKLYKLEISRIVPLYLLYSMHFSVKSRMTEILKGEQIFGASLKLKNGLMDFNEIWYQQYSFIGVDYALHLISKYLRVVRVGAGDIFFFLYQLLVVHDQNCENIILNILHSMHFYVK